MKSFGVRFYCGSFIDVALGRKVSTILNDLHTDYLAGTPYPHFPDGGVSYELRDFESVNNGAVFKGVLAVLRDDAPNIREATGAERAIALAQDEHVIEKNHFLYFSDRELLIWQVNGRGSHISRLEKYLGYVANAAISLGDVIQPEALQRLNGGIVKRFKLRVAAARNADAVDPNNWEAGTFDLMNGIGATTISVEVATRRRAMGLAEDVKNVIHRLVNRGDTRALYVQLAGETDPIDLFADCIKARITVPMVGLYPVARDIFAALAVAKDNQQVALDAYFGQGNAVLD